MVHDLRSQQQRLEVSLKDTEKMANALETRSQQLRNEYESMSEQLSEAGADGEGNE